MPILETISITGSILGGASRLFGGRNKADQEDERRRAAAAADIARTLSYFAGLPSRASLFSSFLEGDSIPTDTGSATPDIGIGGGGFPPFILFDGATRTGLPRTFLPGFGPDQDGLGLPRVNIGLAGSILKGILKRLPNWKGPAAIKTRGPAVRPPVETIPGVGVPRPPGTIPGQKPIRPVVVQPTSPQVTGPEGPIKTLPGIMYPDPTPEIRWPDWGELFPRLPQLDEIQLLPVKLPTIKRRRAPEKAPKRVSQPAPTVTPAQIPGPTPAPTPPPAPRPAPRIGLAQVLQAGALVGQLAGLIGRPGPVGQITVPGGGSIFEPAVPLVPDYLDAPFAQGQATRTRNRTKRCEKTRRKNRKTCWTGLYREYKSKTKFEKWYARDCTTGEFLEKTERK